MTHLATGALPLREDDMTPMNWTGHIRREGEMHSRNLGVARKNLNSSERR